MGCQALWRASPGMPVELDDKPDWYEHQHKSLVTEPREELRRLDTDLLNPGRTWRSGKAVDVFGDPPSSDMEPGAWAG